MHNGEVPSNLERDVYRLLYDSQVCDAAQIGVLAVEHLCLARPVDSYFLCPQCRRIHLHRAGGICIECLVPLGEEQSIATMPVLDDYYRFLAL